MKNIFIFILFVCSSILHAQEDVRTEMALNQNINTLKITSSSEKGVVIDIQIGRFFKKPVLINGEKYYSINILDESLVKEKGNPELPKLSRSIIIPGTTNFSAKILSSKYEEIDLPIIPSKGILSRTINPDSIPYSFSDIYSQDSFYPTEICAFNEPYLIRDNICV